MGVPLKVDNRVIGVIALKDYAREEVYSERDQQLLAILADQIAIALRRIELENERRETDLRVMTQLSLAMEAGEIPHAPGNPQRAERMIWNGPADLPAPITAYCCAMITMTTAWC